MVAEEEESFDSTWQLVWEQWYFDEHKLQEAAIYNGPNPNPSFQPHFGTIHTSTSVPEPSQSHGNIQ